MPRRRRGRRNNEASDATPERSFPFLPLPFRPITDTARVGSCLQSPAAACVAPPAHVFTLSRGDENAERGRIQRHAVVAVESTRRQHQCPSDSPARSATRRQCPLILRVHCVPSLTLRSIASLARSLELAPCCAPERLSASCCRSSSSSSSSASSSSSSPKSYRRSTLSARSGVAAVPYGTASSSLALPLKGRDERGRTANVATGSGS